MEVTRSNFRESLPEIEDTIKRCTFLAIDGEFTGLSSGLERSISHFDTPAEYYSKIRNGALDFLFVQFGLVGFMYDEKNNKYTQRSYNFYLFPTPTSRNAPDCRFLCQASSISFLASHGFDFNKLFNDGIPYLNKRNELELRLKLDEAREKRKSIGDKNNTSYVECPPEHKDTVESALNSIENFMTKKDTEELSLPPVNGFIRKLIYQELWKKYTPDDLRVETKNNVMTIRAPLSDSEKENEDKKKFEEEEAAFNDAIGFTNIIKLISQSRKLIVGHNMLLDLCHLIHRFCEPLPEDYQEFKELLHSVFPYVLDTKFMCACRPLSDLVPSSVLAHVLASVSEPPFTLPSVESENEESAYSPENPKEHEAGYDAYITGIIAIALSEHLAKKSKVKSISKLPSATSSHLSEVINRLYLMKVLDCYIDLERDDPKLDRDAVFHVTFPESWKGSDLSNMFSAFGGVQISWINKTSAYCGLFDKSQALKVVRNLKPSLPTGVSLMTYYAFNNLTQPSPVRRKSDELDKPPQPKRKHSIGQERSSLKRPSVEPIQEEPEETGTFSDSEQVDTKKRKLKEEKLDAQGKRAKLFEENLDW